LLVAIDKFSKWIKACPICSVRSDEAVEFFTDITYCFGIPNTIITDNGSNFNGKKFLCFCDDNNIQIDWAAVRRLRTNGQVERVNRMILQWLKPHIFKRLEKFKARWVAEIPCSGVCGPHQPAALATPYSSWSTGQKQSSRPTSSMGVQG
jgi:transposase InsO family protein